MLVFFSELIRNHILIAGLIAWCLAQVIKTILYTIVNHKIDFSRLTGDGGMPSCHSATVTSVAVMAGLQTGFSSPIFAVACIFAIVVMHDAMGVRLETGKQAQTINQMIQMFIDLGQPDVSPEKRLKELVGHTPLQVVIGGLIGLLVALFYYFFIVV